MRILLVSQMYPGPDAPELGTFVAQLERELRRRGHEIARAVVDRRGGRSRHLALARDVIRNGAAFRADVVYAHFLVPAGLLAALAGRAPLVVTAHGQDVENARSSWLVREATRLTVMRAAAVVAVSDWLRSRLVETIPAAAGKTSVIDCGVDTVRFTLADQGEARADLGWHGGDPVFLCVGSLSERKNVLGLARAFERHGDGQLVFVGDGPLRPALEGRDRIAIPGPAHHDLVPLWMAACDVLCQPSLIEPFGLATLEAMASGRPVVATTRGGPPEFVSPGAGILVDPDDEGGLVASLGAARALPCPNHAGRAAAIRHDVRLQAARVEELLVRAARGRRA